MVSFRPKSIRCPSCVKEIAKTTEAWVSCQSCLTAHHRSCWELVKHCQLCEGTDFYPGKILPSNHPSLQEPIPPPPLEPRSEAPAEEEVSIGDRVVSPSEPSPAPFSADPGSLQHGSFLRYLVMVLLSISTFGLGSALLSELFFFLHLSRRKQHIDWAFRALESGALTKYRKDCVHRGLIKARDQTIWRSLLIVVYFCVVYYLFNPEGFIRTHRSKLIEDVPLIIFALSAAAWYVLLRVQIAWILRATISYRLYTREAFQPFKQDAAPNFEATEEFIEAQIEESFAESYLFYDERSTLFLFLLPLFHTLWHPFALRRCLVTLLRLEKTDNPVQNPPWISS